MKNCVCARKRKLTIHSMTELWMAVEMGLIDGKGPIHIDFVGDIVKNHRYLRMEKNKLVQGLDLGCIKLECKGVWKGDESERKD